MNQHHITINDIVYDIDDIPDDIISDHSLSFTNTSLTKLPKNLTVYGSVDLKGTEITELPEGLKVGVDLFLEDTSIIYLTKGLRVNSNIFLPDYSLITSNTLEPFKDFIFHGCSIKELQTIINL